MNEATETHINVGEAQSASIAEEDGGVVDMRSWTSLSPDEDGSPADWGAYYARNGFHLVPCEPCGWKPRCAAGQESAISAQHGAWVHWMNRARDNMGLQLGPSSIVSLRIAKIYPAIEACAQEGIDLSRLLASSSQPMTTGDAETFELLFRLPSGPVPPARKLARASEIAPDVLETILEFRSGPMHILVPPSVHPELHTPFVWINGPWTGPGIPPLPDELLDLWQTWSALVPSALAGLDEPHASVGDGVTEQESEALAGGTSTSPKQVAANRRNAKKNTGPKTEAGKKTVSRNALKHGLRAANGLLPDEDPQEHAEFFTAVLAEYRPDGQVQFHLVECLAWDLWRLRRIPGIEAGLLTWHCYQKLLDRLEAAVDGHPSQRNQRTDGDETRQMFLRGRAELLAKRSTEVELAAQGFMADAMGPNSLSNLSRYQTALVNNLTKIVGTLQTLQSFRVAPVS